MWGNKAQEAEVLTVDDFAKKFHRQLVHEAELSRATIEGSAISLTELTAGCKIRRIIFMLEGGPNLRFIISPRSAGLD
jgi:bacterioferritin (cytochrome b1)